MPDYLLPRQYQSPVQMQRCVKLQSIYEYVLQDIFLVLRGLKA